MRENKARIIRNVCSFNNPPWGTRYHPKTAVKRYSPKTKRSKKWKFETWQHDKVAEAKEGNKTVEISHFAKACPSVCLFVVYLFVFAFSSLAFTAPFYDGIHKIGPCHSNIIYWRRNVSEEKNPSLSLLSSSSAEASGKHETEKLPDKFETFHDG